MVIAREYVCSTRCFIVYSVLVFKLSCSVIHSSSLVWRSSCGVIEVIYKNFFSELSSPVMGLSEC